MQDTLRLCFHSIAVKIYFYFTCTYVLGRNPKDGMTAAHLAEEFYRINDRSSSKYEPTQPWLNKPSEKKDPTDSWTEQPTPEFNLTLRLRGKKGHKKPDCPKRVRRLRSPQPISSVCERQDRGRGVWWILAPPRRPYTRT